MQTQRDTDRYRENLQDEIDGVSQAEHSRALSHGWVGDSGLASSSLCWSRANLALVMALRVPHSTTTPS